jgi:hypothetical protein
VTNLKAARERAQETMEQPDRGIDPATARQEVAARRKAGTFAAVLERFVELHVKPNTKEGRFAREPANVLAREALFIGCPELTLKQTFFAPSR